VLRLLEVLKQFRPPQPEVEDAGTPTEGSAHKNKAIEGTPAQEKNVSNATDLASPAGTPSDEKPLPQDETRPLEGAKLAEETKSPEETNPKVETKEEPPEVNVPKQAARGMCN